MADVEEVEVDLELGEEENGLEPPAVEVELEEVAPRTSMSDRRDEDSSMPGSMQDVFGAALRSQGLRAPKTPAKEQSIADGAQGMLFTEHSE